VRDRNDSPERSEDYSEEPDPKGHDLIKSHGIYPKKTYIRISSLMNQRFIVRNRKVPTEVPEEDRVEAGPTKGMGEAGGRVQQCWTQRWL